LRKQWRLYIFSIGVIFFPEISSDETDAILLEEEEEEEEEDRIVR
jgi:hypothetical protein